MMESVDLSLLRVLLAFTVVLGLMAGLAAGLKHLSSKGFVLSVGCRRGRHRRLMVVESLPLDARRRCVIVRCDDREHLLLLGGQNDIVVETNLPPANTPDAS